MFCRFSYSSTNQFVSFKYRLQCKHLLLQVCWAYTVLTLGARVYRHILCLYNICKHKVFFLLTIGFLFLGFIRQSNRIYHSWASVIFSLELFIETLINFVKIDFIAVGQTKSSRRFTQWCMLVLASIVSLSSSVRFFRSAGCNDILTILFTLGFWTKPCTAARFTLATGIIVCVLSLSTITAAFLLKGKKKIIFVVEIIVSSLSLLFYAIAVGLVTAPNAPGSEIGNLYYFTWLSLAISIMLFLDCLMEKFHPIELQVEISPVVANTAELPPAEISSVVATAEILHTEISPVVAKMPPAEISLVVATTEMPPAVTSSEASMSEMPPGETFPEASVMNQTQATPTVGEAQV